MIPRLRQCGCSGAAARPNEACAGTRSAPINIWLLVRSALVASSLAFVGAETFHRFSGLQTPTSWVVAWSPWTLQLVIRYQYHRHQALSTTHQRPMATRVAPKARDPSPTVARVSTYTSTSTARPLSVELLDDAKTKLKIEKNYQFFSHCGIKLRTVRACIAVQPPVHYIRTVYHKPQEVRDDRLSRTIQRCGRQLFADWMDTFEISPSHHKYYLHWIRVSSMTT